MKSITSFMAAVLLAAACAKGDSSGDTSAAASTTMDANAKAAMVSDAIAANPSKADSILTANGYTKESFEREMYEIAADSSRSAAYAAAKKS
jgi:hypothetical protein